MPGPLLTTVSGDLPISWSSSILTSLGLVAARLLNNSATANQNLLLLLLLLIILYKFLWDAGNWQVGSVVTIYIAVGQPVNSTVQTPGNPTSALPVYRQLFLKQSLPLLSSGLLLLLFLDSSTVYTSQIITPYFTQVSYSYYS